MSSDLRGLAARGAAPRARTCVTHHDACECRQSAADGALAAAIARYSEEEHAKSAALAQLEGMRLRAEVAEAALAELRALDSSACVSAAVTKVGK